MFPAAAVMRKAAGLRIYREAYTHKPSVQKVGGMDSAGTDQLDPWTWLLSTLKVNNKILHVLSCR